MTSSTGLWSETEVPATPGMRRDQRRNLSGILDRLLGKGACSYTAGLGPGLRQAAHRYFGAKTASGVASVSPSDVLSGHVNATASRCAGEAWVLVAQDTTSFAFPGQRKLKQGMAPLQRGQKSPGIWCHSALAMTSEGAPLGVLHLRMWMRDPESVYSRHDRHRRPTEVKESAKWLTAIADIEAALPETTRVLVLADREADLYDYLAVSRRPETHLLTRVCRPRYVTCSLDPEEGTARTLTAVASSTPVIGSVTVEVPARPGRAARSAVLDLAVATVYVWPPRAKKSAHSMSMRYQLVSATEREGSCPRKELIGWLLLTDVEVPDGAAAAEILRLYGCRWQIEVLHKTMKSWLRAERLQTEDPMETMNVLAAYFIVAWRALYLTHVARHSPETPVDNVLTRDERDVLEAHGGQPMESVGDALLAITVLGGYTPYKNGPPPGPKPLMDGLVRLDAMVHGWRLARGRPTTHTRSDTR
jgi:hypothetical protein